MSYDLKDQIREVADFIDESQTPIRGSEVRAGTTDRVPVVNDTSRPLRNVLIVAVAFVLVLIVLGGVAWLSPLRDSVPPAEERSVETTIPIKAAVPDAAVTSTTLPSSPVESTLPSPTLEVVAVANNEPVFGNGLMASVAVSEDRLVVVGVDGLPDSDVVVWTSLDGVNWIRAETDRSTFEGVQVSAVAPLADGFILVGAVTSGDNPDAAVWTSPDGVVWTRTPHDELVFGGVGYQVMVSVTSFEGGVVAVGESSSSLERTDAAVWFSSDGSEWTRIQANPSTFDHAIALSVVPFGSGVAAVGLDISGGDADAAVWMSPDGLTWTRTPHDESVLGGDGDQLMHSVVSFQNKLVAVGIDGSGPDAPAAVWTSSDGIAWTRVPHDEAVFGGGAGGRAEMMSITTFHEGLVAVGLIERFQAAIWTSSDGITWSRVTDDELIPDDAHGQQMKSVAEFDEYLVAVGVRSPLGQRLDSDPNAVVWILYP